MARLGYGGHKTREGTVVSDKMDKTVVVAVQTSMRARIYKKIVRRIHRFVAHDETNDAQLGDRVRIVECRPYSRRKRWQLAEVLTRAERPEVAAEEIDLELLGEVKAEKEEAAAAPVEVSAEEAAPEGEAEEAPAPAEAAAEEVPPVEEAVEAAAEEPEAEEAVGAAAEEPEAEEAVEAAAEEPEAEEAVEAAGEEPEAEEDV